MKKLERYNMYVQGETVIASGQTEKPPFGNYNSVIQLSDDFYSRSDVDPMIRELRAKVLAAHEGYIETSEALCMQQHGSECTCPRLFKYKWTENGTVGERVVRLIGHYKQLIRSGKPGWWQHDY